MRLEFSLQPLSENLLISWRIQKVTTEVWRLHVKCRTGLSDWSNSFCITLDDKFLQKIFMKIRQVVAELFHERRQTDRQTYERHNESHDATTATSGKFAKKLRTCLIRHSRQTHWMVTIVCVDFELQVHNTWGCVTAVAWKCQSEVVIHRLKERRVTLKFCIQYCLRIFNFLINWKCSEKYICSPTRYTVWS